MHSLNDAELRHVMSRSILCNCHKSQVVNSFTALQMHVPQLLYTDPSTVWRRYRLPFLFPSMEALFLVLVLAEAVVA